MESCLQVLVVNASSVHDETWSNQMKKVFYIPDIVIACEMWLIIEELIISYLRFCPPRCKLFTFFKI